MTTSFRNFMASREDKQATFTNPATFRRAQLERFQPKDIHQPDPRYPSFQESKQHSEYKTVEREIDQQNTSYRSKFLQKNAAKEEYKNRYDDNVQQAASLDKPFTALNGEQYNPEKDTPDSFFIRDKVPWIAKAAEMIGEGGDLDRLQLRGKDNKTLLASPTELEFLYYQQVLQKNNISHIPVRNLPSGQPDWEGRLLAVKKQAYDMLLPVSYGDIELPNVRGYQQRNLQKDTAFKRGRAFTGLVANPLNEEFIPVATAQAAFALPGWSAGELGVLTPGASETMQKVGATAGEWVGFGFGIGKASRSVRWMAEDIALPFKVVRGLTKFTAKKFGIRGIRKAHQTDNALAFPNETPPSVELTSVELTQSDKPILSYAKESVGGTEPEAEFVEMSVRDLDQLKLKVTKSIEGSSYETTYQINTVDDYYNAAGDILGMTAEHTAQAKRVAQPILESLARMFGVSSDDYIKNLMVGVRGREGGGEFAARTIPLGESDASANIMNSLFRRTASLIEFVKATESQTINQADAFASVQHELSHIILQDIFTYAKSIKDDGKQLERLSDALKNQIIKRQEALGEPFDAERTQLIQSLTPEEIGDFITVEPGSFLEGLTQVSSEARALQIQRADVNMLLQEAGADLFARYLINIGTGANTGHIRSISYEFDSLFQAAAKSLSESWNILRTAFRAGEGPAGIARQQTTEESKILSNFQIVMQDIAKGAETAGPGPLAKSMTEGQRAELAKIFYRSRYDDQDVMKLARLLMAENPWQFNISEDFVGEKMKWDLEGAVSLITNTTARHTSFGKEIIQNNHFQSILDAVRATDPDFVAIHENLQPTMKLRLALSEVATDPKTKLAAVHDIASDLRPFVEPVRPLPNLDQRLVESAFKNDRGEPIVFFHGATHDFDIKFDHDQTGKWGNILGPALYVTDFDQLSVSYAIQTQNPNLARVQAFHVLVPPERVMSLEMVGSGDEVAARFIDHALFNPESGWQKNVNSYGASERKSVATKLSEKAPAFPTKFFGQKWGDAEAVDISRVFGYDGERQLWDEFLDVFEQTAREEAYYSPWKDTEFDQFLDDDVFDDDLFSAEDFLEDQLDLDTRSFGEIWDKLHIANFKGEVADFADIRSQLVISRAAAIASRNVARNAVQHAERVGNKVALDSKIKALKSLETQVAMLEAASSDVRTIYRNQFGTDKSDFWMGSGLDEDTKDISAAVFRQQAVHAEIINHLNESFLTSSPMANVWNVIKSMGYHDITHPKLSPYEQFIAPVDEIAAQHFYSEKNRVFIRNIQDSFILPELARANYGRLFVREIGGGTPLDRINKLYADTQIEAITEVGGSIQGGAASRVVALVGPNQTIQNNRQFVTYKTNKVYDRKKGRLRKGSSWSKSDGGPLRTGYIQRPDGTPSNITGNPIMDKVVDYKKVEPDTRYSTGRHIAVWGPQAARGDRVPLLIPVTPKLTPEQIAFHGAFPERLGFSIPAPGYTSPNRDRSASQLTFEYSAHVKPTQFLTETRKGRVPKALVSIHKAEKVSPRRAKREGVEPVGKGHYVLHTTPIRDGSDLTLSERQEIADSLIKAAEEKQLAYLPKIKSIDINTTFGDPNVGRNPASDETRGFWRANNPKGGDIDETVTAGEFNSSPTEFGRQLEDGVQLADEAKAAAVEKLADQKLIASPRAVENPVYAADDIINMQHKAEVGKVVHSYHGIPRVIASNLTPAQLDYRKWFKTDGIESTFGREDIDLVITDTTGVYRNSDGTITEAGEDYLSEKAAVHVNETLMGEDYKKWIANSDRKKAKARTKGNAVVKDADRLRADGKISDAEYEKRAEIGQKMSGSEPEGGYKPLQLHPLLIKSMINTGFRRLKAIHPTHAFEQKDYSDAIQKLIGVKTPHVGSAAEAKVKLETPRLAGMFGTERVKFAEPLTPYEVNLVWKGLGLEAAGRLPHKSKLRALTDMFIQAMNFPRMLRLAMDAGAIWNQGGMLIGGALKPVTTRRALKQLGTGQFREWATGPDTVFYQNLGRSVTGMFTAGSYRKQMDLIYTDPNYDVLMGKNKSNLFISDLDGPLTQREEAFLGNIFGAADSKTGRVKSILGKAFYPFKAGERFHNLYLNRMRYDLLNDYYKGLGNIPQAQKEKAIKSYADFLNKTTGRGDLGKLDKIAPELSTVLLAPRWMVSRFQVPYTVAKTLGKETLDAIPKKFSDTPDGLADAKHYAKSVGKTEGDIIKTVDGYSVQGYRGAHTSKQMAQDLVRTFGVIGGIATLLMMNGFKVETDWRKTSYLKISKGRVNIDLTMGLGSVWRMVARAAYGVTARKEVTSTGAEFDADVMRQIGNFTRAKLSPLGASAAGVITGTNYFGEEVTGREVFIPGQSTNYEDFLPLMVQQIKDASEQIDGGPANVLLGIGAVSGLNVGIYPDKDDIARELTGSKYEDLYGYEQKYIDRMYYTGTEFQPSDYKATVYEMEQEQYEWIETIMSGTLPNGEKASRIYYKMKEFDIKMQGVRRAYFGDQEDTQSEGPESRLKKAQADYYALMSELMGDPRNQATLTAEQIEEREQAFLSRLGVKERDYILANKTNFMVPPSVYQLIKNEGKADIRSEERKAVARQMYIAQGKPIPDVLKESPINELSQKYYAVARSVIESNQARERLSQGRTQLPLAQEQIDLTRTIAAR